MQVRLHGDAINVANAYEIVEREAERLDRRFTTVDEVLKRLDVDLQFHEKTDSYRAKLVFHAPDRQLAADGHTLMLDTVIRRAFDDLDDKVDEYLARVRHEPQIHREQIARRIEEEGA